MKRHLCGPHAVREALAARPRAIAVLYASDLGPRAPHRALLDAARAAGLTVEERPNDALDALSDGVRHQGLVAISGEDYPYLDLPTLLSAVPSTPLLVALDEVTDPHNFGAIVRSTVALGAHGVVITRDRAAPVNGTVVRTSAGATEHTRIARVTNLARALDEVREAGLRVVGLDAEGSSALDAVDLRGPTALVMGSEGHGLRRLVRERCDVLARIPLAGAIASLNVSVAAGVALYEAARQRRA